MPNLADPALRMTRGGVRTNSSPANPVDHWKECLTRAWVEPSMAARMSGQRSMKSHNRCGAG